MQEKTANVGEKRKVMHQNDPGFEATQQLQHLQGNRRFCASLITDNRHVPVPSISPKFLFASANTQK